MPSLEARSIAKPQYARDMRLRDSATGAGDDACAACTGIWRLVNLGFVGLGAMGALIVPRLMAAGHSVTGWNRSRDKAEAADRGRHDIGRHAARGRRRASEIVFSIVTDSNGGESRGARPGRHRLGPAQGRHLHRHEHDRAGREPRGRGGIRQGRLDHAGRPALRQPGHGEGRQCLGDDRRRRGRVRARQAGAAGDRAEGDADRRQRPRLPDEDRGQPAADGRGDLLRRSGGARRERRRRRATSRSTPSSRASRPRRCWAIAGRSSSKARCRRCRSPT